MGKTFCRRRYLIDKGFQSRFILRFVAISTLGSTIAVAGFIFLARRRLDAFLNSMRMPDVAAGDMLLFDSLTANAAAILFTLLMFFVAARGLFRTAAGPLHRIHRDLQQFSAGNLGFRVVLREGDEFVAFADSVNAMADGLNRRFKNMRDHVEDLSKTVDELRGTSDNHEANALRTRLARRVKAIDDTVKEFTW